MRKLLVLLLVFASASFAAERSSIHTRAFQRHNPCPSTGERRGACPGYVIDHIYPLCAGGADHPDNMQWQSIQAAKEKDRWERSICRAKRLERAAGVKSSFGFDVGPR